MMEETGSQHLVSSDSLKCRVNASTKSLTPLTPLEGSSEGPSPSGPASVQSCPLEGATLERLEPFSPAATITCRTSSDSWNLPDTHLTSIGIRVNSGQSTTVPTSRLSSSPVTAVIVSGASSSPAIITDANKNLVTVGESALIPDPLKISGIPPCTSVGVFSTPNPEGIGGMISIIGTEEGPTMMCVSGEGGGEASLADKVTEDRPCAGEGVDVENGCWGDQLDQPWYTCLYSPHSLEQQEQQSPEQEHFESPGVNVAPSPRCLQLPSFVPPDTLLYPVRDNACPPQYGVPPGTPTTPLAVKTEEEGAPIPHIVTLGDVGGGPPGDFIFSRTHEESWWLNGGSWSEPWLNPHTPRYASEEGPYWASTSWQVATSGMMEEGLGSPEDEGVNSPQDDGSISGRRPDSKKCGVCGDRALGYNFNAITCESCKAFFRRNALKNKEFRCPFQESCKVDQVTRRFCQKCRLRKCFEIGMKKEWIMTDEEKQRKKQKIEENRARKLGDAVSDEETVKSSAPFSPFSCAGVESAKPQAVVVGVIRSDDEGTSKILRASGQTDVHSQERIIIQSTGLASERVLLPSPLSAGLPRDSVDYSSDYANSPSDRSNILLQSSEDQDSREASVLRSSTSQFVSFSQDVNSPSNSTSADDENAREFRLTPNITEGGNSPFSEHKIHTSQRESISDSRLADEYESELKSPGCLHSGLTAAHSVHETTAGEALSMVQVMDINIKKEVEDRGMPSSGEEEKQPQEQADQTDNDTWQNFSVQEALRLLEPGCKRNLAATGLTMMDSIMNTAISAEYSAFSLLGSSNPRELNKAEKIKLSELSEANKGLMAPLCEDYNFKDLSNPSLINIINLTEIAIRRLIKMSKRISAFKSLCQEDQIALLKGGCTEMMILRSVCAYDPDKDSWKIQQDHDRFKNIKLKVLKAAPGNVYEEHKRFILAFQPEWRRDHNIIFLLSAITLFMPERPNIIHCDAIKHEQCSYLYLLKRYLECKYGGCEGRTVYHRLLERINHLHILNENHIRVFLEVNPQEVEPLLIEIFDLKQR